MGALEVLAMDTNNIIVDIHTGPCCQSSTVQSMSVEFVSINANISQTGFRAELSFRYSKDMGFLIIN